MSVWDYTLYQPSSLSCHDCGLEYGSPGWADFVIHDNVWAKISPTGGEGGILCVTCMFKRMQAIGLDCIEGHFTSGPCAVWKQHLDDPWFGSNFCREVE